MAPGIPNFILLLVILIYASPPNYNEIGPKLTKFAIGVVFGVVRNSGDSKSGILQQLFICYYFWLRVVALLYQSIVMINYT